jgi:hypothetical protein
MKMNTTIAEPAMAIRPLRIESAPSDGPTVRLEDDDRRGEARRRA